MFIRIGNQLINKQSIWGFIKTDISIIIVSEPRKLFKFFGPKYLISGTEFFYNTESECSVSFENILKNDILNNYTYKKSYIGNELQNILKKADTFDIIKK